MTVPGLRWDKKVGGEILDGRAGKAFAANADRSFRNVESGCGKSPGSEEFGVVAHAAADGERLLAGSTKRMRGSELNETRVGAAVAPGDDGFSSGAFLVENLKPTREVSFAMEFGGEFASARTIRHEESL